MKESLKAGLFVLLYSALHIAPAALVLLLPWWVATILILLFSGLQLFLPGLSLLISIAINLLAIVSVIHDLSNWGSRIYQALFIFYIGSVIFEFQNLLKRARKKEKSRELHPLSTRFKYK